MGKLIEIRRLQAVGDPVQIADWNVHRILTSSVAEKQIGSALDKGEVEIAEGFVALAAEHNVSIAPAVTAEVRRAVADQNSAASSARRFSHGFLTGEARNAGSLAGALLGDYLGYGDVRDLSREGMRCLTGRHCDPLVLGLAGGGIVLTVASFGLSAPEHTGLSLIKFAQRDGRLNPGLLRRLGSILLDTGDLGTLGEFAGNIADVREHANIETALDAISLIETPEEGALIARLALGKGRKTGAVLRLLGRKAFRLEASSNDLVKLFLWFIMGFLCFCASCKAGVERMIERQLARKKLRRARDVLTKPA
jgi:hypothetical protein